LRERVSTLVFADGISQPCTDGATSVMEITDSVEIHKRAILSSNPVILAELLDEQQRITQAAREYELRKFTAFDAGFDEINETEHVVVELMLTEKTLDMPQLRDRKREARRRGFGQARRRPIEIKFRRLIVTRRQNVVGPRTQMAVALEELRL